MTIEADIVTTLSAAAGVTSVIGSGANCRLYPAEAPQDVTYPCVVYQRIASTFEQAFGTAEPVAAYRPVFQFSCWSADVDSPLNVRALAAAVRDALLAMTGSTVTVYTRSLLGQREEFDEEGQLHRVDLDVELVHSA